MTEILARLIGRLPVGWLQLIHNRARLIAAVAGIAFANLLVFVQLGIIAAMDGMVTTSYSPFQSDIMIAPQNAQILFVGAMLPRRVTYLALADPGVAAATPLYIGNIEWKRAHSAPTMLVAYGLPTEARAFAGKSIVDHLAAMAIPGQVLLDKEIRSPPGESSVPPTHFELNGRTVTVAAPFRLGSGFGFDGGLMASDQTFLQLANGRTASTPSQILVNVKPGEDVDAVAARLRARLAPEHVQVRTRAQAIADEITYINTQVPMGIIFGMGVVIGLFVGLVIVYQVLATDVAAHMREYATFKAMGYGHSFFLGIVLEEALIIAFFGFVPGVVLGTAAYAIMASATDLPLAMTAGRAATVFAGTVAACTFSGALATLRLAAADPAELFG